MAGRKVQHWKHGWIPVSPEAKAYVAGKGPRPTSAVAAAPEVTTKRLRGDIRLTTVEGHPEVYFREDPDHAGQRSPEEYREVAEVVSRVLRDFPEATANNPVEITWSDELADTTMADTDSEKPHRIRLNPNLWDDPALTMIQMVEMRTNHFGLTAEADDPAGFRANVITHELGHVLHMRDQDKDPGNDGVIDELVYENVTPGELGYTRVPQDSVPIGEDPPLGQTTYRLDRPQRRWRVDSLNRRSVYATTDPYEFFAEAFLDGIINGDQASESGKRAVARAKLAFGGTP